MDLHLDTPLQRMGKYPDALKARIVRIAKLQGGIFGVTPRYRDYAIQNACKQLKKAGVFKQIRYGVFEQYRLVEKSNASGEAAK